MRNAYSILVGKPEGRGHSEDLGIVGRIILDWILGKWNGCIWLRIRISVRFLQTQ
jgi:hypothetical protein